MQRIQTAPIPLVAANNFIIAARESGYRGVAAAVSELIDNSLQAHATTIDLFATEQQGEHGREVTLAILDDGTGMCEPKLLAALQFGGSERFGDRAGLGRFGMGLPSSSISQSRRVEVYTWLSPARCHYSYLDIDEISRQGLFNVPEPSVRPHPEWLRTNLPSHGTLVVWSRCDRLQHRKASTIAEKLYAALGRTYRYALWAGVKLRINGTCVRPLDPLHHRPGPHDSGAIRYGSLLRYEIMTPAGDSTSTVRVQFTELPVKRWRKLSIDEKRALGVFGGAGVSIIRAGREIDYGWHFFGSKRRENYDDWWRCEVKFEPALDELFGVTNSKQGITPTMAVQSVLTPDMESIARTLNSRVRKAFAGTKEIAVTRATIVATQREPYLPAPSSVSHKAARDVNGLRYRIRVASLDENDFFTVVLRNKTIVVTINEDHPFYRTIYQPCTARKDQGERLRLELLLLSAARGDLEMKSSRSQETTRLHRRAWSDALVAFLDR